MQADKVSICTRCEHREEIRAKEVGTVYLRCGHFGVPLAGLGKVEHCTGFSDGGLSWLFAREAWIMRKNDDGEWKFTDPNDR